MNDRNDQAAIGEWHMPDPAMLLSDVLGSPAFGVPEDKRTALALALRETGFLVPTAYYVPHVDELFAMYRELAEVDYHGRGRVPRHWLRWVMCAETQQALYRRHVDQRTMHTPALDAFIDGGDLTPSVSDDIHAVITMRAASSIPAALDVGYLFDMPIRRDPAARRPLFELIPASERQPARPR